MSEEKTPDHRKIYLEQAEQYEFLISREDYQSNIIAELEKIDSFDGKAIVELGTGTGRLSRLVAPRVRSLLAFDASHHMLEVAAQKLREFEGIAWHLAAADHRRLPVRSDFADLVFSGWSLVYLVVWYKERWEAELEKGLAEIERVLKPGGTAIILETLGTGRKTPQAPDELLEYLAYLEAAGFSSTWIRTDYRFDSMVEAEDIVSFFFGDDMLEAIDSNGEITLPECTGIWWKTYE